MIFVFLSLRTFRLSFRVRLVFVISLKSARLWIVRALLLKSYGPST